MSNSGLAALDAAIYSACSAAGIADAATYKAPDGDAPSGCQVFVDRDIQTLGDTRQFKAGRVEVAFVLASMQVAPRRNGVVVLDGVRYLTDEEIVNDGSISRWVVRRG